MHSQICPAAGDKEIKYSRMNMCMQNCCLQRIRICALPHRQSLIKLTKFKADCPARFYDRTSVFFIARAANMCPLDF